MALEPGRRRVGAQPRTAAGGAGDLADEVVQLETGNGDPAASIRALTEGKRGADRVIEAVGRPEAWQQALAMVQRLLAEWEGADEERQGDEFES